jgi:2-polyprenyl-6-methoxyphenol hydroxylase-like FAD-dependent oxidoreductase
MNSSEVLIVGAGPSGLVLALYLAKAGVKARIIDKNSGPGQQSRAMRMSKILARV